ncbi:MAG: methyltransferase, partial [Alphaproteobacteria bacterium]|nr:methyltransferase [Alphaproteobacteria bacterium]
SDCDVHLFSNVLHDWDEPDCRRLLSQSAQSLSGNGRIVIHYMFLNDDKTGPLWTAEYSVLLAGVTQGRLYSTNEISGWLQPLGFVIVQQTPTALGRSVLEAVRQA